MPNRKFVLMVSTILVTATAIVAQQHSYTQEDINAGAKLYESNCGNCHGENGDKIVGIDFGKGTFKTARTDDDIIRIIRSGVPNTGMPPSPLSEVQANTIVAFVRSMPNGTRTNAPATTSLTGDATRGKTIFEGKGNCASCHAISGVGGTSGPDLGPTGGRGGRGAAVAAAVPPPPGGAAGAPPAGAPAGGGGAGRGGRGAGAGGGRGGGAPAGAPRGGGAPAAGGPPPGGGRGGPAVNPQQIERSIVDPSAEMAAPYRVYQVVTKANVTARGTLLNQDTFSVQMRDSNDKLMSYWKSDLKDYGFVPSPMPSYKNTLTPQEIADVVSYLVSLRSN
jgi:mono/diheme cytochrome c family protein